MHYDPYAISTVVLFRLLVFRNIAESALTDLVEQNQTVARSHG